MSHTPSRPRSDQGSRGKSQTVAFAKLLRGGQPANGGSGTLVAQDKGELRGVARNELVNALQDPIEKWSKQWSAAMSCRRELRHYKIALQTCVVFLRVCGGGGITTVPLANYCPASSRKSKRRQLEKAQDLYM